MAFLFGNYVQAEAQAEVQNTSWILAFILDSGPIELLIFSDGGKFL